MENKRVRKAVIPAAGYGTRFLPATKVIAKEMFPIIDTPTIDLIVREALDSGITEVLIIVSSSKNSIIDYFDRNLDLERVLKEKGRMEEYKLITDLPNKVNIHFLRQKEMLGLGHAVLQAKSFIGNEPFAVLLGDDLFVGKEVPALKQLINAHEITNSTVLGTCKVSEKDISKFGVCEFAHDDTENQLRKLKGVEEKPQAENAKSLNAIVGRYVISPGIFALLESQTEGFSKEIQLTDAIGRLMEYEDVYAFEISGNRYDIGSRAGFIEATLDFALRRDDLREDVIRILKDKVSKL